MGTKKHQTYTHGEIVERLDDIEKRLASLQRRHDVSLVLAFAMALAGFVVALIAIGYASPKEWRWYYNTLAIVIAVATFIVLWFAGRMKD